MPFIRFQPFYQERLWGGRNLETLYNRSLPAQSLIGESWELVDRPEAQSCVISDYLQGQTLQQLWIQQRESIFGKSAPKTERFPLIIKILDAQTKISLQVHPPQSVAQKLSSETKTEAWYFIETKSKAEIFLGFKKEWDKTQILEAIENHIVKENLNCYYPKSGDVSLVPAGCLHAIGEGNLIVEVQQNSDTTYRLFDWDRLDVNGKPRTLHLSEAFQSINYDSKPLPPRPLICSPLVCEFFSMEQKNLTQLSQWKSEGETFSLLFIKEGALQWEGDVLRKGEFGLISASEEKVDLLPLTAESVVLQVQWGKIN